MTDSSFSSNDFNLTKDPEPSTSGANPNPRNSPNPDIHSKVKSHIEKKEDLQNFISEVLESDYHLATIPPAGLTKSLTERNPEEEFNLEKHWGPLGYLDSMPPELSFSCQCD